MISCYWGHEISTISIRSLQAPALENEFIWVLVLTGAGERRDSRSVWCGLTGSLKVTGFCFAQLHSSTDGWLQNTRFPDRLPILHPHICVFFLNSVCLLLQAQLWHLPGSLAWKFGWIQNLQLCFSSSFLVPLYFHISCQLTLQLCLDCPCQATVPPTIDLLILIRFNFLPAGHVSSKPNTGHLKQHK